MMAEYGHFLEPWNLEPHYSKHVSAMTTESLHAKSEIAAELAWRDQQIESLRQQLSECQKECEEEARLNGMGSEREAKLMAECHALRRLAEAKMDEVAACRKDAERYRWLRDQNATRSTDSWLVLSIDEECEYSDGVWVGCNLDAAIDEAMK